MFPARDPRSPAIALRSLFYTDVFESCYYWAARLGISHGLDKIGHHRNSQEAPYQPRWFRTDSSTVHSACYVFGELGSPSVLGTSIPVLLL